MACSLAECSWVCGAYRRLTSMQSYPGDVEGAEVHGKYDRRKVRALRCDERSRKLDITGDVPSELGLITGRR